MKRIVLGIAALFLTAGMATAETSYFGEITVPSVRGTCPDGGPIGLKASASFRPQVSGNGPGARMSIFYPWGAAINLELPNGNFGGSFKPVNANFIADFAHPVEDIVVRFISVNPAINTKPDYLEIEGEAKNLNFSGADCIVLFRAALIRRPGQED